MLFIICGHGEGDTGAVGGGYQEQERVRTLAKKIKQYGGEAVVIGDISKNWYKRKMITNTHIPKGAKVLELHMDSYHVKSAKGGHVIIASGLQADKYDKALAKFISGKFSGRSKSLVNRADLQNPRMAKENNINYRLMECCFISNSDDLKKFNSQLDEIAKGILTAMGEKVVSQPSEKPSKLHRVQVGAFESLSNAEKLRDELKSKGYEAIIV